MYFRMLKDQKKKDQGQSQGRTLDKPSVYFCQRQSFVPRHLLFKLLFR